MKVKDFVKKFPDDFPVVLMERGESLDDITPNGNLYEAVNCVESEYRNPVEGAYAEREVESAECKLYDAYHSALIVRVKECAA